MEDRSSNAVIAMVQVYVVILRRIGKVGSAPTSHAVQQRHVVRPLRELPQSARSVTERALSLCKVVALANTVDRVSLRIRR